MKNSNKDEKSRVYFLKLEKYQRKFKNRLIKKGYNTIREQENTFIGTWYILHRNKIFDMDIY